MAVVPGTTVAYTDDNDITWAATVINTFTNDESEDMVTISLFGSEEVIVVKESDLD